MHECEIHYVKGITSMKNFDVSNHVITEVHI